MSTSMRALRKAPLIVVALLLALSFAAPPALAAGGSDSGGGGGSGSVGGNGNSVAYVCGPGETGWHKENGVMKFQRYISRFLACDSDGTGGWSAWQYVNVDELCQVGYEVFRFYSYGNDPNNPNAPAAVTRSTVGQPEWCTGPRIFYYYPHPQDYAGSNTGPAWQGWQGTNKFGQDFNQLGNGNVTTTSPRGQWGNCAALTANRQDPLAKYFVGGTEDYNSSAGQSVRDQTFKVYQSWLNHTGDWRMALTAINASNGAPINSGNEIAYGDGKPCSSDMDFATADGQTPIVYGTCYIPLEKRASRYVQKSNNAVVGRAYYSDDRGGTRYVDDYGYRTGVAAPAWRDFLWNVVASEAGPGAPYVNHTNTGNGASMNDRQAAADAARDFSRCKATRAATANGTVSTPVAVNASEVQLTVSTPNVFQAGWAASTSGNRVKIDNGQLMCGPTNRLQNCAAMYPDANTRPRITTLHYGATVKGVNGYLGPSCAGARAGCDFTSNGLSSRLAQGNKGSVTAPAIDRPMTIGSTFYSATQRSTQDFNKNAVAAEKVQIDITGGAPGTTPWAEYSRPLTSNFNYRTCTSLPMPNGEAAEHCYDINVPIVNYEIVKVPVTVWTTNAAGRKVKAPLSMQKDVIGATGISK